MESNFRIEALTRPASHQDITALVELLLDTKAGSAAETLYRQLGWIHVGTIPRFAVDPDGVTPHGAAIFYKELDRQPATTRET